MDVRYMYYIQVYGIFSKSLIFGRSVEKIAPDWICMIHLVKTMGYIIKIQDFFNDR